MGEQLLGHYEFSFEKLIVWQNSISFAKIIYNLTNSFPKEEIYGLTSQLRRSAVSISSNLAEGSAKKSLKDQARYTEIAFGSLLEILNQIIIAYELGYLTETDYRSVRTEAESLTRQINALKISQLERYNEKK